MATTLLGLVMAAVALFLTHLINLFTHLAFFGHWSWEACAPSENSLGGWVMFVPVLGGLLVGIMARFGSKAIRGHGIPEAMEQILQNRSRIPARLTWLKPLSAAISIGTGGPFGAEGPIIATGGASGSLVGQIFSTTAMERKILLAAGAAAGMSATFGSPVSAVVLAIELLLFEFKPRSFVPVALASVTAASARNIWLPTKPMFSVAEITPVHLAELSFYLALGALVGVIAVGITRSIYWIEDQFEKLPVHWMWWPALGAVVVGIIGYWQPKTLGVGYDNISNILNASLPLGLVVSLCLLKFISWSVALGSGTSGGTLAPLLTFGSGIGLLLGNAGGWALPVLHVQPHLAALVGMAALFAAASQALFASVIFACETTGQMQALLPLLAGCSTALVTAKFLYGNSIMSEKIARRGVSVPSEYSSDVYAHTRVAEVMDTQAPVIASQMPIQELISQLASHDSELNQHQAYLLVGDEGQLEGIITRGDLVKMVELADLQQPVRRFASKNLIVIFPEDTLHTAVEKLLRHRIGRLPVVKSENPSCLIGYLSRADILSARQRYYEEELQPETGWLAQGMGINGLRIPLFPFSNKRKEDPAYDSEN
ncbi:MAG: chloride channel protein [Verrucomicrobiales bacterium]|nr:chloride channel protein [Verrucomicrobiales bacterium]